MTLQKTSHRSLETNCNIPQSTISIKKETQAPHRKTALDALDRTGIHHKFQPYPESPNPCLTLSMIFLQLISQEHQILESLTTKYRN